MRTSANLALITSLSSGGDDTLSWLTSAARDALPGVHYVSVSVAVPGGDIETVGATDPLAMKADALQYELMQGPCVDCVRGAELASTDDVTVDARWPQYANRVAELGIRAQLALRVPLERSKAGGLNLYSTTPGGLDAVSIATAQSYASQAGAALQMTRRLETLSQATSSRTMIGTAIGIVMERFRLSEERAFQYLVTVSQTSNVKLRQVASELVERTNATI